MLLKLCAPKLSSVSTHIGGLGKETVQARILCRFFHGVSNVDNEVIFSADYQEALKIGEVLVAYARVMMIGPGGVGKSSFLRGLMNLKEPRKPESTMLVDTKTVKRQFWAKAGKSTDSFWAEITKQDEIQELSGLLQLVAHAKSAMFPSRAVAILSTMDDASAPKDFYPMGFKSQSNQSISLENVSHIQDSVVRNILTQAIKSRPLNPHVQQPEVLIHVWDCGGQTVFLDVLPAFLTSRTMFLLFFDARQDLLSKCNILSYKKGRVLSKSEVFFHNTAPNSMDGQYSCYEHKKELNGNIHSTIRKRKCSCARKGF